MKTSSLDVSGLSCPNTEAGVLNFSHQILFLSRADVQFKQTEEQKIEVNARVCR